MWSSLGITALAAAECTISTSGNLEKSSIMTSTLVPSHFTEVDVDFLPGTTG